MEKKIDYIWIKLVFDANKTSSDEILKQIRELPNVKIAASAVEK